MNAAILALDSLSQSQSREACSLSWMLCVVPREGRSTPGSSPKLPEYLGASPRYCRRCTWVWQFRLARDTDPLLSRPIGNMSRTFLFLCQGLNACSLPRADRRGGVPRSGEGVVGIELGDMVDKELYAEHPLGPAGHSPIAARCGRKDGSLPRA
jgi:hypothetical protein